MQDGSRRASIYEKEKAIGGGGAHSKSCVSDERLVTWGLLEESPCRSRGMVRSRFRRVICRLLSSIICDSWFDVEGLGWRILVGGLGNFLVMLAWGRSSPLRILFQSLRPPWSQLVPSFEGEPPGRQAHIQCMETTRSRLRIYRGMVLRVESFGCLRFLTCSSCSS